MLKALVLATVVLVASGASAVNPSLLPRIQVTLRIEAQTSLRDLRREIHKLQQMGSPEVRLIVRSEGAFRRLQIVLREFKAAGYDMQKISVD